MKIAIIDDLQSYRDMLEEYINRYQKMSLTKTEILHYDSGERFFENAGSTYFDVIFLDIFMDGMTGVEVAKKIRLVNKKCLIVFVSASKDFIHESYDINALYYLIKPFEYEAFQNVMQRVDKNIYQSSLYIEFRANREHVMVNIEDIVYIDLYKHYLQFHLKDKLIKTYTLAFNDIEKTLVKYPNFISCYRCIIVNLNYISKIDGKDFVFRNGWRVPINRKRFTEIKDIYARYIFDNIVCNTTVDMPSINY